MTTALPGHAAVAIEALAAGKHVLIEKPMAANLADAHAMINAAEAADRILMVSQNYRFYPAAQTVAALVAGKTLGPVGAVRVNFRKLANSTSPDPTRFYALADPLLLDMSIHHFDLMRFILGQEPVAVTCHAWNPAWSKFADPAAAVATVQFDGGAVVNYQGSWVSTDEPTLWAGQWVIECAKGTIEWTGRNDQTTNGDSVTVHPLSGPPHRPALSPDKVFDRAGSIVEFSAAIREGRSPVDERSRQLRHPGSDPRRYRLVTNGPAPAPDARTRMTRVTVWNEFRHEQSDPEVAAIYPDGIHSTLAAAIADRDLTTRRPAPSTTTATPSRTKTASSFARPSAEGNDQTRGSYTARACQAGCLERTTLYDSRSCLARTILLRDGPSTGT